VSKPVFVRKLTKAKQTQLTRLIRSNEDARIVRRAHMIRLSFQGKKATEIAEMQGIDSGHGFAHDSKFQCSVTEVSCRQARKGRPRKTTERYVTLLKEAMQKSPRDFGYPLSCWTCVCGSAAQIQP